ncbi:MAG: nucleotidyltransferase domain-containing protein [archaeon]
MLTKKQVNIFGLFARNEFGEYTFKEIKRISKEKSNSVVQNAIKAFLSERLITEKKIGTSKIYRVNHSNSKAYSYFELFIAGSISGVVKESLEIIKEKIEKHLLFYSIVIFGSYSANEQSGKSDLDVAVFIDDEDKRNMAEAALKSSQLNSMLKIDGHAITKNEFLEMLKSDNENLGKQIARKHLIIHNPAIFYSLLKEGMKNGFRI